MTRIWLAAAVALLGSLGLMADGASVATEAGAPHTRVAARTDDDLLAKFLERLPPGRDVEPLSAAELADSVFRHLRATSFMRTAHAFRLGEAAYHGAEAAGFRPCRPGSGCLERAHDALHGGKTGDAALLAVSRPEVAEFLGATLRIPGRDTVPIREVRGAKPGGPLARAVCVGGEPTIEYAADIDPAYSPIAFAFVRAHEYAHWLDGHLRCGPIGPPPGAGIPHTRQRELDADCHAARIVTRDIRGGTGIIVLIAERFWELNWPAVDGYPSTRERAEGVYRERCEHDGG